MFIWRFLVCILFCLGCRLEVVHGQDDEEEETPSERMEWLADEALEYLNKDHESSNDQMINYMRALRYFALALDLFDDLDCGELCEPGLVRSALATYGQAAEVHLDLVEMFFTGRLQKQEDSLEYAKSFCDRGMVLVKTYGVGDEGEQYFGALLSRYEKLRKQHDEAKEEATGEDEL